MVNQSEKSRKVIFISTTESDYSRSGNYFNYIKYDNQFDFSIFQLKGSKFNVIKQLFTINRNSFSINDIYFIMSPSHYLILFLRVLSRNKIILDAGWPLSDATARKEKNIFSGSFSYIKNFTIDLIAFHLSSKIIVESERQKKHVESTFYINTKKLKVVYTGFNELNYNNSEKLYSCKLGNLCFCTTNKSQFRLFFRGKYNEESGLRLLAKISNEINLSEDYKLIVLAYGLKTNLNFSPHVTVVTDFLKINEMAHLYNESELVFGQLSENDRLKRTIPHKAFESAYFSKAYLSPKTASLNEIFDFTSEIIELQEISENGLIERIQECRLNRGNIKVIGNNMNRKYNQLLNQELLGQEVCRIIRNA